VLRPGLSPPQHLRATARWITKTSPAVATVADIDMSKQVHLSSDESQIAARQAALLIELARTECSSHAEMLQALLTAFTSVAMAHDCCRQDAARALLRAGGWLMADQQAMARTTSLH